ncbi:hypothetical protein [Thorsellia anophelis]|uniref:Uncharacterized protein n=1 Tax=Thorsellia anophelis DSM 18579 TaxID=1123402 RepID=A0A1I0EE32_9GAMM|nr:hypothetical protein [Thorsellia anophelis]SET42805.1 hypothetical protein SAMN02583745_02324 [Thorsellia anophelis DSM 18579]
MKRIKNLIIMFSIISPFSQSAELFHFDKITKKGNFANEYVDMESLRNIFSTIDISLSDHQFKMGNFCEFDYVAKQMTDVEYYGSDRSAIISGGELAKFGFDFKENSSVLVPSSPHCNLFNHPPLLFNDNVVFFYDDFYVSYHKISANSANNTLDSNKGVAVGPSYPYLCYYNLYNYMIYKEDCRNLSLKSELLTSLSSKNSHLVYSLVQIPKQKNNQLERLLLIKQDGLNFPEDFPQSFPQKILDFSPNGFEYAYKMEGDRFTLIFNTPNNHEFKQIWQFDGKQIYLNDRVIPQTDEQNALLIGFDYNVKNNQLCYESAVEGAFYTHEITCVAKNTLSESYKSLIQELNQSKNKINFLSEIEPNKNETVKCNDSGCLDIQYRWEGNMTLEVSVSWSGGEDIYRFTQQGEYTTTEKINMAD